MGDWNHVNGYLIRPELQYAVEAALTPEQASPPPRRTGHGKDRSGAGCCSSAPTTAAGVEPEIGRQGQPRSIPI